MMFFKKSRLQWLLDERQRYDAMYKPSVMKAASMLLWDKEIAEERKRAGR